jgi:hypothetical protein
MLLTIVFGLIAKLMLVSEGCDVGTTKVKQFNWNQVLISVLIGIMKHETFKTGA